MALALPFLGPPSRADAGSGDPTLLAGIPSQSMLDTITVLAERVDGPSLAAGANMEYTATAQSIADLPAGTNTALTDVLAQMPGVSIDQNQQIHIRNTEGPQFQYQINGVLVPLDINTNPPFLSMLNPLFIKQLDLHVGVLPARYSYATGGVVDIETKDGCEAQGRDVTLFAGQRDTVQPSAEVSGCSGRLGYYASALYGQSNTAFSSATPGPTPVHDWMESGQAFGFFSYALDAATRLTLLVSAASSNNELPDVPGLAPQYALAGAGNLPSAAIDSSLNFRDALAMFALSGRPAEAWSYTLAYSAHTISEDFRPDDAGELIYQGVASTASHTDVDNTLQGDLAFLDGAHRLGTGFYVGQYRVAADDRSLTFPVDPVTQLVGDTPVSISNNAHADNVVSGLYVDDLWTIGDRLRANLGLRRDALTGFTSNHQLDPTMNVAVGVTGDTTVHAGFARYMQVPSFQGISPTAAAAFAGTTAAGPAGIATPLTEDDYEWDVGLIDHLSKRLTLSVDNYYERTRHYLDTGQFGVVPIFAPFNYGHGYIWGSEMALNYKGPALSAYANLTVGTNLQKGVTTGQFNFPGNELAYIDTHYIVLDHQPHVGSSAGLVYDRRAYSVSVDATYSSGLRAGFADEERLPHGLQFNLGAQRKFSIPGVGELVNRVTVLNVLDRVNLIRPAEGIGIFQSAYGPRLTFYDSLTLRF
ncbi:MAG: TonB-dependent receptor [Steroidobacteraceae bacterium]